MCDNANTDGLEPFSEASNSGRYDVTTTAMSIVGLPAGKYVVFLEGKDASVTVHGKLLKSADDEAELPAARATSSMGSSQKTAQFSFPGDERDAFRVKTKGYGVGFILSAGASASVLVVTRIKGC